MDPANVVFHVVDSAEDTPTAFPVANYAWVVFRFVASTVLPAGETAATGLGATVMSAEEILPMTVIMLP